MEKFKGMPALGAGLLAGVRRPWSIMSTRYGTLIAWAKRLGLDAAIPLLQQNLDEEKATDKALTELAKTAINEYAEAAE